MKIAFIQPNIQDGNLTPSLGILYLAAISELDGHEVKIYDERLNNNCVAEIVEFKQWLSTLGVVPVISALREKAHVIQSETMDSLERKLPNLSDRDIKILNKHTKSIINQLLKDPILQAKELAARPDAKQAMDLFMKIFNIEELVHEQHSKAAEINQIPVTAPQASFQS